MDRRDLYFTDDIRKNLCEIRGKIASTDSWQIELVDAEKLSRLTRDSGTSSFSRDNITGLWKLGLLQADLVYSVEKLNIPGLVLLGNDNSEFIFTDNRVPKHLPGGYSNALRDCSNPAPGARLLFHPFRCYVLYHLDRVLRLHVAAAWMLLGAERFGELVSHHKDWFNQWSSSGESLDLIRYRNDIVSLCAASEPGAHLALFGRVKHRGLSTYEATCENLHRIRSEVRPLFRQVGENAIEFYRNELCENSEDLDPNKSLHLVIRLMSTQTRERLKGPIAGAMMMFHMAEVLRRNLEAEYGKQYPEENECGHGQVYSSGKIELQGTTRVLDRDRAAANQFLRRVGLDHGIRVNVYVEGKTEYEALNAEFAGNSSVLLIDLKGQFAEKGGKGVAFRESLRNDLKARTFSLIVFDGDVSDNLRAARKAAEANEICGMFFVSKPDFEFVNFTPAELCEVLLSMACDSGDTDLSLAELQEATKDTHVAEDFFSAVAKRLPAAAQFGKGRDWGRALVRYATDHPRDKEFGDDEDRLINRIIRTTYQCCSITYESTRRRMRVDPETGRLVEKE